MLEGQNYTEIQNKQNKNRVKKRKESQTVQAVSERKAFHSGTAIMAAAQEKESRRGTG